MLPSLLLSYPLEEMRLKSLMAPFSCVFSRGDETRHESHGAHLMPLAHGADLMRVVSLVSWASISLPMSLGHRLFGPCLPRWRARGRIEGRGVDQVLSSGSTAHSRHTQGTRNALTQQVLGTGCVAKHSVFRTRKGKKPRRHAPGGGCRGRRAHGCIGFDASNVVYASNL